MDLKKLKEMLQNRQPGSVSKDIAAKISGEGSENRKSLKKVAARRVENGDVPGAKAKKILERVKNKQRARRRDGY